MQCTVQAGTRLEDLGEYRAPINQALLNQGNIDQQSLAELQCALWIATPVLKVLCHSQLPGLELLNHFPHQYKALFVYGGYWQADYIYPEKSKLHRLYGRSSNQEMLLVPKSCEIDWDDYVFLRPTQSEAVIPQFAQLYAYAEGKFEAWDSFRE